MRITKRVAAALRRTMAARRRVQEAEAALVSGEDRVGVYLVRAGLAAADLHRANDALSLAMCTSLGLDPAGADDDLEGALTASIAEGLS